jgi:hypothetical protein
MSNEDKAKKVADRIAARLQTDESQSGGWDDLQNKLDRMYGELHAEPQLAASASPAFAAKAKPGIQPAEISHASQERFNINEAVVEELVEFFEKEKACSFEPDGKPCDHCAMCSSRGF